MESLDHRKDSNFKIREEEKENTLYLAKPIVKNFIKSLDGQTRDSLLTMNQRQAFNLLCQIYQTRYGVKPAGTMLFMLKTSSLDLIEAKQN